MAFSQSVNRQNKTEQSGIARWLPAIVAVVLMVVVALVSMVEVSGLRKARARREHSLEVILAASAFQNNLLDVQRGLRGYVNTGDTNALAMYQEARAQEPEQITNLLQLTSDNRDQQARLKALSSAIRSLFAQDNRVLVAYTDSNPATNEDPTGEQARELFGTALNALKAFQNEEQGLLDKRNALETRYAESSERLLVIISALAAILVIVASIVAGHELDVRRRAEDQLHRALMLQKAILNSSDYGIMTTDADGMIQTFNPAAERILGYTAEQVVGKATPLLWRDSQEMAERAQNLSAKLGIPVRPSFEAIAKKVQFDEIDEGEWTFVRKDGKRFIASLVVSQLAEQNGGFKGYIGIFRDISAKKMSEAEREKLIFELKDALAQVKTLSGLIPICGWCKKIRNDKGYWSTVEHYVHERTDATFSHGMCPECQEKFKADIARANGGQSV